MNAIVVDERLELLMEIARDTLVIDLPDEESAIFRALEAAYDAGLRVGYHVGRDEALDA